MKLVTSAFFLFLISSHLSAQIPSSLNARPEADKPLIKADASCGQCQFGMKGQGCDLAVRIDGRTYYVDGAGINDFGDAHAADGFCEAIRKAEVQGEVVNDRFELSYFKLVEEPKMQKKRND